MLPPKAVKSFFTSLTLLTPGIRCWGLQWSSKAEMMPHVSHLEGSVLTATGLPIICCTDPVVAFTAWPIVLPRIRDLAYANSTLALSPPTADQAIGGLAASLWGLGGELAYSTNLPARYTTFVHPFDLCTYVPWRPNLITTRFSCLGYKSLLHPKDGSF